MPDAFFRFDISAELGFGHAVRSTVLANHLACIGWRTFAAVNDPAMARSIPCELSFEDIFSVGADNEARDLQKGFETGCDLLVVDHYGWDEDKERQCRSWAARIAVIEDQPARKHDADLLICPSLGVGAVRFAHLVSKDCEVRSGAPFVLVRNDITRLRAGFGGRRSIAQKISRVLVALGGGPSQEITRRAVAGICGALPDALIDVVMAESHGGFPELDQKRVTVHKNTKCMPELMVLADIAVGSAGVNALERCCLGLPSLIVVTVEHQRDQARALAENDLAHVLGASFEVSEDLIEVVVREFERDDERRHRFSCNGMTHIDGLGCMRAAELIDWLYKKEPQK